MTKNAIKLYGNKVYGMEVSKYGLENECLDYKTLSKIVGDCILNNTLRDATLGDWEIVSGDFDSDPYLQIYQDYIISESGYKFLEEYTDEIVWYNESLDIYVWSITHLGTSWDYVLTNVRLES